MPRLWLSNSCQSDELHFILLVQVEKYAQISVSRKWRESCFVTPAWGRTMWNGETWDMFAVEWWQVGHWGWDVLAQVVNAACQPCTLWASLNSAYFVLPARCTQVNLSAFSVIWVHRVLLTCSWRSVCFFLRRSVVPCPRDHGGRHPLPRWAQRHNPESVVCRLQHATGTTLTVSRNL